MGYEFPSVQQEGWDVDEKSIKCVDDRQELCFKCAITNSKNKETKCP